MEEQNLIFGIFSLLFVVSLVLFANLCVKLEKKKQPSLVRYGKSRSDTTESMQKLQSLSAMESVIGGSVPHRHLSTTTNSHYSDKRQRPFPNYTPIDRSPHSRSTSSTSPKSVNSLDLSSQRIELSRFRVGSESQKIQRDNPYVTAAHQRQWSMEAPRSINNNNNPSRSNLSRPAHLTHEQLKRTEPTFQFNRENSLRSSSSTIVSQKRNTYQLRSSPSGSVATGTLPMEAPTSDPSTAGSVSESRHKLSTPSTKTIIPKYSESKVKGTPVRTSRMEIESRNDPKSEESISPYRECNQPSDFIPNYIQNPTYNEIGSIPSSYLEDSINLSKPYYQNPRLVKRQLSYEDSNCYPSYYQPSTDSTCQLYSTQSNKNLPLRMRFPKLSNGTDFADDETEGTSVCQSIYSSYTSLYQTDTEEFMIGDPQMLKLSRELESSYSTDTDYRTPLVAQCAKHYTEDLIRSTRCPSNLSVSDSEISFVWQGGDLGKHEYTPNDLSPLEKRTILTRPTNRSKQGYTDYTGGLSFFSFVRKGSIPEETLTPAVQIHQRAMTSPSRFNNIPVFTNSPLYIPPESTNNKYHNIDSISSTYDNKIRISNPHNKKCQSTENLKLPQRLPLSTDNSRSHPNIRAYKHTKSSDHSKSSDYSPNSPSIFKMDNFHNLNNSNNELSEGSLTHL